MFTKLMAVLIAAVLVFGGAAATASAAQSSLPVDALYPLKTLQESVALGLTVSTADKLEKALGHAQRRVDEMRALGEIGADVPAHLVKDYAERVEYTLRLASKMSDPEMAQALEVIRVSLQEQLGVVGGLQAARPQDQQLASVAAQLGQYMELVKLGLGQPAMFREQVAGLVQGVEGPSSTEDPSVTEAPSITETPEPGDDNSNDANANDSNTNDDSANVNDSNANSDDDSNANGDDDSNANGDDDDSNTNGDDDDSNTNGDDDSNANGDDDSNANGDDDSNTNGDDDDSNANGDDDDSNANGDDDDSNANGDDDSNANGDDDDSNANSDDDDSNANGDDDSNANGDDSSAFLNPLITFVSWIKTTLMA